MTSRESGPVICDTCRNIDFEHLLTDPGRFDRPNPLGYQLVNSEECELCAVLTPTTYAGHESELRSYLSSHGSDTEAWTGPPGVYACIDSDWVSRDVAHAFQPVVLRVDARRHRDRRRHSGEVRYSDEWGDSGGIRESEGSQNSDIREDGDEGRYSEERQHTELPQIRHNMGDTRRSQLVFCTPPDADEASALWRPCPLQETPNYMAAREWLNDCQSNHGVDCKSLAQRVQGMRLVDVLNRKIVHEEDLIDPHWLTLSYVWGQFPSSQISGTKMLPDRLPRTVEDAIAVTRNLNYRYLWVDELCIDQSDPTHRISQIGKMDQIYQGADLTIVAAYGNNKKCGLPGVNKTPRERHTAVHLQTATVFSIGPDPRSSLKASAWWTRAWTFQEGYLSRRLLVFTEHQMAFYCRETAWMEALFLPPNLNSAALNVDLSHLWISLWDLRLDNPEAASRSFPSLIHFEILVGKYIDRNMSHSNDILNAAAGVLHHLGQGDEQILNIAGLPFHRGPKGVETLIPLEHVIAHALGWFTGSEPCIRRGMFPSWTWAGWSGLEEVGWMWLVPKEETYCMRNVQLENEFGEAVILPERIEAASGSILQRQLDTVKAIVFEAPCLPVTSFTVEDRRIHISGLWFRLWRGVTVDMAESMNAQQGIWSCFLLRTSNSGVDNRGVTKLGDSTVLICRWVDEDTAERFAQFNNGRSFCHGDIDSFETHGEMRRVRLI